VLSGAGGAGLAAVALATGSERLDGASAIDPGSPAVVVAAVAASALAFAWRPRAAALLAVIAGAVLVGLEAPGAGVALGLLGLAAVLSGLRFGRLTLAIAAGPALAAIGLLPLLPALAGLLPRWPARLWAAAAGVAATVVWQIAAGAGSLLAGGG